MLYGAWRRMHLVKSVVFIIILWCSFRIICKIIHMRRFSFQLLCRLLTRRVAPRSLEPHKSRANDGSSDRWKQRALRIKYCFPMKKNRIPPINGAVTTTRVCEDQVMTSADLWPLIGREWSHYLDAGLWLVESHTCRWPPALFRNSTWLPVSCVMPNDLCFWCVSLWIISSSW